MPMFDRICRSCGKQLIDCLEPSQAPVVHCPECGAATERAWLTKPSNVIGDECDVWIEHGLCNADGSPRRYYSKSEIAAEAARRGLVPFVRHQPDSKGSDKSANTTRWI